MTRQTTDQPPVEWPTLAVAWVAYGGFAGISLLHEVLGPVVTSVALALILALHSSLCHEILHGHPFRSRRLNEALAFPAIGLFVPYGRFRDQHLAHHYDPNLTDPYDDPESNYADPAVWARTPRLMQMIYEVNNTLLGRMVIGPVIGLAQFYAGDLRRIQRGERGVIGAYALHLAGVMLVLAWCQFAGLPLWQLFIGAYLAMSVLKIRTFLEHRAHVAARGRSVIIEDRGLLSLIFLKNNLHALHHCAPEVPWYRLQSLYAARRDEVMRRNEGYVYGSYAQVFARYFLRRKDPVPHPLGGVGPLAEPMHPVGPLDRDEPAFDARQHPQA